MQASHLSEKGSPEPSAPREARVAMAWWVRYLLSIGGGLTMALAFPPYDCGDLVWLGLLPLLSALWCGGGKRSRKTSFALGWVFGMSWYSVSFWWIHEVGNVFDIPMGVFMAVAFVPLMAVYAVLPGLWALVAGRMLMPLQTPETIDGEAMEERRQRWDEWVKADLFSSVRAALGCGALWVLVEWLRGKGALAFTWNSPGMALYNGLSFVQWAEFVGTAVLSFIPISMAVILWRAFRRTVLCFRRVGRGCRPWDFYAGVVILFGLFTGGLALSTAYSPARMLRERETVSLPVLAVQINKDQLEHIREERSPAQYRQYLNATVQAYNEIARDTMQRATKMQDMGLTLQLPVWVVWPESALPFPLLRREDAPGEILPDAMTDDNLMSKEGLPLARQRVQELGGPDFVLFTGVDEVLFRRSAMGNRPVGMLNSLACIAGDWASLKTVSKQHLMPFGEYIPLAQDVEWIGRAYSRITGTQVGEGIRPGKGTEPLVVPAPGLDKNIGVIPAICYEDTVGDLLRRFARPGAQVIVNASNDAWFRKSACGVQQARSAAMRCIELRRSMVRAANMGVCCSIAPNGAVIHSLLKTDGTPHLPGYSYGVLPVDPNAGLTLYARWGDWAVWVCLLVALLCLLPSFRSKRGNHQPA